MQYRVLAALKEDMNEGRVWISHPPVMSRSIIEIRNKNSRKSIFCEALQIDDNYKYAYTNGWTYQIPENESVVTINSWYRAKLNLENTNQEYALSIKPANHLYGKFMVNFQHPQAVVRIAMWLGVISVALGLIGVLLGYKD